MHAILIFMLRNRFVLYYLNIYFVFMSDFFFQFIEFGFQSSRSSIPLGITILNRSFKNDRCSNDKKQFNTENARKL